MSLSPLTQRQSHSSSVHWVYMSCPSLHTLARAYKQYSNICPTLSSARYDRVNWQCVVRQAKLRP
jgi:hypothetical protein